MRKPKSKKPKKIHEAMIYEEPNMKITRRNAQINHTAIPTERKTDNNMMDYTEKKNR